MKINKWLKMGLATTLISVSAISATAVVVACSSTKPESEPEPEIPEIFRGDALKEAIFKYPLSVAISRYNSENLDVKIFTNYDYKRLGWDKPGRGDLTLDDWKKAFPNGVEIIDSQAITDYDSGIIYIPKSVRVLDQKAICRTDFEWRGEQPVIFEDVNSIVYWGGDAVPRNSLSVGFSQNLMYWGFMGWYENYDDKTLPQFFTDETYTKISDATDDLPAVYSLSIPETLMYIGGFWRKNHLFKKGDVLTQVDMSRCNYYSDAADWSAFNDSKLTGVATLKEFNNVDFPFNGHTKLSITSLANTQVHTIQVDPNPKFSNSEIDLGTIDGERPEKTIRSNGNFKNLKIIRLHEGQKKYVEEITDEKSNYFEDVRIKYWPKP